MCIAVVVPKGLTLSDKVLSNCWENNSDGAGFMYAEDGVLHVQKGFMTFKSFLEAYEPHKSKGGVLHFRIKTHGALNEINTHPFIVDDNLAFVHNGVISDFGCKDFSDTWHFNENVIKLIREQFSNFLSVKPIKELIGKRIGWSKLAFLDNLGNTTIINEDKGEMSSDGVWFSNNSWNREPFVWEPPKPKVKHKPYIPPPKTNITPLPKPLKQSEFKTGDYVRTHYHAGKEDHTYKILYFGWGQVVVCLNLNTQEMETLLLSQLKRGYGTATMVQPNGHLKVGAQVEVMDVFAGNYAVVDSVLNRLYHVPTRCVYFNKVESLVEDVYV